jgi:hypothetical protein
MRQVLELYYQSLIQCIVCLFGIADLQETQSKLRELKQDNMMMRQEARVDLYFVAKVVQMPCSYQPITTIIPWPCYYQDAVVFIGGILFAHS